MPSKMVKQISVGSNYSAFSNDDSSDDFEFNDSNHSTIMAQQESQKYILRKCRAKIPKSLRLWIQSNEQSSVESRRNLFVE